jgi:hypothetical protein
VFILTTGFKERKVSAIKNFKYQNTNSKQIRMTEIQNPKQLAFDLI